MIYGRDGEQEELDALLTTARSGRGGALVLRGEPGIGKTTLLRWAAERAPEMTVLSTAGVEAESELPFAGLQQLLSPLDFSALPEPHQSAVEVVLGCSDAPCTDLLLYTAVLRLLRSAGPLLVIVDDLQWWDRASATALSFCARRAADAPIAFVLATDGPSPDLPELALSGLSLAAAGPLFDALDVPAERRRALLTATAGNPLAMVECAHQSFLEVVPLSDRLRTAFTARLPADALPFLEIVAADGTDRSDVHAGAAHRLGIEPHPAAIDHPLVRSAIYQGIRAPRAVHRALADELIARGEPRRALWHCALAASGQDDELAASLEIAAADASSCGGLSTAADLLRRAASLSSRPSRDRRLAAAGYAAWKSGQPTLARSLSASVSDVAALDRLHGLIALSDDDQRSAHDHLVRAARGRPPEEAVGLLFMAVAAALHADIGTSPALARLSEAGADLGFAVFVDHLARLRDGTIDADPWQLRATAPAALRHSDVHQWLWPLVIARYGADPRAALRFGVEARTSFSTNGMQAVLAFPELWLAELEHELGHWASAFSRATEGLRSAQETGQRARAADFHAVLALVAPNPELCRRHASAALAMAIPLHNRLAAAKAKWALGLLALSTGDNATAVSHLSSITEPTSPTGHTLVSQWAAADLVEACVRTRTPADHVMLPSAATPLMRSRSYRAQALLTDAPDLFAKAASEAFPDHPHEQARAALLHGEWLRRNKHQARSQLRLAHDTFTHLGATHWTSAAARQLRPATGTKFELTPQELSVARLAAKGLTNKEIGASLFLSPRTVGYHLYKIFPKLGIASRSQLRELDLFS
ncbi:helix-turn-helix transcriptional regulator [Lentzea tibetensis]|uniref:helix-turn-helix transcriptional regulator n=1 Tax=Lentzea tibetensis TaxID=2591470 RepID=UPI0016476EE6|nr:LuxR family transcriptional regulator [Lentzea tibetensis]